MKQFNGLYGCTICYHPGERIEPNKLGWVYPYKENVRLRSYDEVWAHAHIAEQTGSEKYGIKGKSVVLDVQKVPEETPLDYMHLVLIGMFLSPILSRSSFGNTSFIQTFAIHAFFE